VKPTLLPRTEQHIQDNVWEFSDGTSLVIAKGRLIGTLSNYGKPGYLLEPTCGNWEYGCALFVELGARLPQDKT
jgi:hypothetical protein